MRILADRKIVVYGSHGWSENAGGFCGRTLTLELCELKHVEYFEGCLADDYCSPVWGDPMEWFLSCTQTAIEAHPCP